MAGQSEFTSDTSARHIFLILGRCFLADFGSTALYLMQQRIILDKVRANRTQSAWGAQLRSLANRHSGLDDIRKVSSFNKLSAEEKLAKYGPYQDSLRSLVACIIRAYNAKKYENREESDVLEGSEYDAVLYFYPGEQLQYNQQHTMFQRGGTTADSILRMTRRNVALKDPAVLKMHTNIYTNQWTRIKSYIHDGWPEELELPESTNSTGLVRLNLHAIFKEQMRFLSLLLDDEYPGVWFAPPAAAAATANDDADTAGVVCRCGQPLGARGKPFLPLPAAPALSLLLFSPCSLPDPPPPRTLPASLTRTHARTHLRPCVPHRAPRTRPALPQVACILTYNMQVNKLA